MPAGHLGPRKAGYEWKGWSEMLKPSSVYVLIPDSVWTWAYWQTLLALPAVDFPTAFWETVFRGSFLSSADQACQWTAINPCQPDYYSLKHLQPRGFYFTILLNPHALRRVFDPLTASLSLWHTYTLSCQHVPHLSAAVCRYPVLVNEMRLNHALAPHQSGWAGLAAHPNS